MHKSASLFFLLLLTLSLSAQTWIKTDIPEDFEALEITNSGQVEGLKNNISSIFSREVFFLYSNGNPILGAIQKTTPSGFRLLQPT